MYAIRVKNEDNPQYSDEVQKAVIQAEAYLGDLLFELVQLDAFDVNDHGAVAEMIGSGSWQPTKVDIECALRDALDMAGFSEEGPGFYDQCCKYYFNRYYDE